MFQTLEEALQHINELQSKLFEKTEVAGRREAENAMLRKRVHELETQNRRFSDRNTSLSHCTHMFIEEREETKLALDGAKYLIRSHTTTAEELRSNNEQLRAENQQLRADVRELHGANQLLMDSNGELRQTVRELQAQVAALDKSNEHLANASRALVEVAQRATRELDSANP